jgi:membrane associated rhomboid family serine protease
MVTAAVGFHCPECARTGRQKVLTARSLVTRPILTQILIAINVAVFVYGLVQPGLGPISGSDKLILDYGLYGPAVDSGDWFRIVTSGFLHSGLVHLGFNMAALWFIGSQLEPALGRLRFGVLYGASLLAGSLGVLLVSPGELTVGASGAIFGMLGGAVAAQRAAGVSIWDTGIGTLVVVNLILTFSVGNISIGGHLGGLVGGLLVGTLYYELGRDARRSAVPVIAAAAVGIICFVVAISIAGP